MIIRIILGLVGIFVLFIDVCFWIMIFDETKRPKVKSYEEDREIGNNVTGGAFMFAILGAMLILFSFGVLK